MSEILGEYGRRRVKKSVVNDSWNGFFPVSQALVGHDTLSQHHITLGISDPAATGIMRIRMRPTGLKQAIPIGLEAVNLATGPTSFVVNGYYDMISAEFTSALTAGMASLSIASTGENLSALPVPGAREYGSKRVPTTFLARDWNGVNLSGGLVHGHEGMTLHHVALRCASVPATGSVQLQGIPLGGRFFGNVSEVIDLTVSGTINLFVVGMFSEFRFRVISALSGAGLIDARVASSGEDLSTAVTTLSQSHLVVGP